MMTLKKIIFICIALFYTFTLKSQLPQAVSLKMESNRVHNGKLIKVYADILYKPATGELISHYTYPLEYVVFSNKLGEAKIYYPAKNEVQIKQDEFFSSENNLLHQFIVSQNKDFGFSKMGCKVINTRFDQNLMITKWYPPATIAKGISEIELVYDNDIPVYSAYYKMDKTFFRKIYYSDYIQNEYFSIPGKVTEYTYKQVNDSIVSRMTYSDIKYGANATNSYSNFTIPDDAKLVK